MPRFACRVRRSWPIPISTPVWVIVMAGGTGPRGTDAADETVARCGVDPLCGLECSCSRMSMDQRKPERSQSRTKWRKNTCGCPARNLCPVAAVGLSVTSSRSSQKARICAARASNTCCRWRRCMRADAVPFCKTTWREVAQGRRPVRGPRSVWRPCSGCIGRRASDLADGRWCSPPSPSWFRPLLLPSMACAASLSIPCARYLSFSGPIGCDLRIRRSGHAGESGRAAVSQFMCPNPWVGTYEGFDLERGVGDMHRRAARQQIG